LTSVAPPQSLANRFYQARLVRRVDRWLHAMPHPSLVVEIAEDHVAAARWSGARGHLDSLAVEPLPAGAVVPSPIESNLADTGVVAAALRRVFGRVPHRGGPLALLIPDLAVRVFISVFETLPRRNDEALALLRFRLKKSVPFDVEEASVSWVRQTGRDDKLEVVQAVARCSIVREYEDVVRAQGGRPGVVMSSTLAALPLLEERGATLLVRLAGRTLTTVILRGAVVCVYRSTELPSDAARLEPQAVLDEVFPAVAYYQDTWSTTVDRARLAGFGARDDAFRSALGAELKVVVGAIADAEGALDVDASAQDLLRRGLDSLVGWAIGGGS